MSNFTEWKKLDETDLNNEWEEEGLDYLFFSGYPKEEEVKKVKDIFFSKINDFSKIENIDYEDISHELYGNGTSLIDLKSKTDYMKKDIDYIKKGIESGRVFQNSTVKEENGKLKYIVHGTNNEFEDFQETKATWFTESIELARSFGENIKEVVVDIKNPLDLTTKQGKEVVKKALYEEELELLKTNLEKKCNLNPNYILDYSDFITKMRRQGFSKDVIDKQSDLFMKYLMMKDIEEHLIYQQWDKIIDFAKKSGYDGIKSLEEPNNRKSDIGMQIGYVVFFFFFIMTKEKYINKNNMPMPLMMRKNGELKILGGRTRSSVAQILNKDLKALVIDYNEMQKNFFQLKKKDFMNDGYGVFAMEDKKTRLKLLHHINKGTAETILDSIPILDGLSKEQKVSELNDLKAHLFSHNSSSKTQSTTTINTPIIKNGKINEKLLHSISEKYTRPKKTKRGKINFKAFANTFGNDKVANITTPIGHTKVLVNSQFWKMISAKENRQNVLFNIKSTLKNPIFIIKEEDSFKYYSSYKKPNGSLFHMLSICGKDDDDNLVLKTSYQIRDLSAVRKLAVERGSMLYCCKDSVSQNYVLDKNNINENNSGNDDTNVVIGKEENVIEELEIAPMMM